LWSHEQANRGTRDAGFGVLTVTPHRRDYTFDKQS
jgi:hypothetical protein